MGTSSSNYGPKRNTPLLPDWSEGDGDSDGNDNGSDSEQGNENNDQDTGNNPLLAGNWAGAKRTLGSFSQNPTQSNFRSAAKSYIRASGGAGNIAKTARVGKVTSGKIISFLNGVKTNGIDSTYESLGLGKISGDSIDQVFNNLANVLSSEGGTDEETIARNAVIEALAKIYEDFDIENKSLDELDNINETQIDGYIEYYISSYIYERWLHELGVKIEEKDISPANIVRTEQLAFDFIQSAVSLNFSDYSLSAINVNTTAGKAIIDEVFLQAYTLIEEL